MQFRAIFNIYFNRARFTNSWKSMKVSQKLSCAWKFVSP